MKIVGTLPAGQYYIGDPCYVLREDDRWSSFLKALDTAQGIDWNAPNAGGGTYDAVTFEFDGHQCFVSPTNTGDGLYRDQHGIEYTVDAGMIAVLPIALTGAVSGWTFKRPFKVGATPGRWNNGGKRIKIGQISIRT